MRTDSKRGEPREEAVELGPDTIEQGMRERVRVLVLVTLGIKANGQRVVVDMRLAGQETMGAWEEVIAKVIER